LTTALLPAELVAMNPQLFITATFVGLVILLALFVSGLVLLESRTDANATDRRPPLNR
jgi:hypothetical protein